MSIISQKICLIGDFNVGKTSLVRRFIEDKFSDRYLTTIGVKVSRKSVLVKSSQQVNLLVWDIEGHTKQKSIPKTYLQGARGAIVVGDLTRNETLQHLSHHLQLFSKVNPQGKIIVALNKSDLISAEKLNKLVELYNCDRYDRVLNTYTTSAKTGQYVNTMFDELATCIIEKM